MAIFGNKTKTSPMYSIITNWLNSKERAEMLVGKEYYEGKQEILKRERLVIDEKGGLSPVQNLPNNRIVDNQYKKLVDQKANYALGKPMTIATANESYLEALTALFSKKMSRQIRLLCEEAIMGGIAYLYPYYNESGEFKLRVFPSYEVLPIWTDGSHTELNSAIRIYSTSEISNDGTTKDLTIVEEYTIDGINKYVLDEKTIKPYNRQPHVNYIKSNDTEYNWNRLPIIPFKYNAKEIPLIRNVKGLQDSLNQVLSDFQNNMEEDPRNTILVLKNYDGTNLAEFRRNLATYGVVKVHTVDGVQGGVDALKVEVDSTNYQALLMQLKRAIVENGRGFDAKEERMDGDPNQMNIESMYTDIDLDVNQMESEFQAGFEDLKWFIDQYFSTSGKGDFSEEKVEFVFNRDIFINEDAKIDNCVKSMGLLSNQTIVSHHPWISDLQHEMKQIENDKQAEMEEMEAMSAFQTPKPNDKK